MEKPFPWSSGRGDTVISGQQVLEPLHARRSDYDLCRDLGRRLGQSWPDRVEDVWDQWLREAGLTYAELAAREQFWLSRPAGPPRHETIDPASGEPLGFGTPSGKVELASSVLADLDYDPLPRYEPVAGDGDADRYPLFLMTGNTRIDATHHDHRQIASLRARHPDPIVELDPRLAARRGIDEGDWVRIETPRGHLRQRARLVPGLGEDRVNAERWWFPERAAASPTLFGLHEANVNMHLEADLDACDPAYGTLPFRVARCQVVPERVAFEADQAREATHA
jgi:anaerobic selenocysteine-containing dehydrogenase